MDNIILFDYINNVGIEEIDYGNYVNGFVPLDNEMDQKNINKTDRNALLCPKAPRKKIKTGNHGALRVIPVNFNNVNFIGFNDDDMDLELFRHNRYAGETAFRF